MKGLRFRPSLKTTAACAVGLALLVGACGKARILEGLVAAIGADGTEIRLQTIDVHLLPGKSRQVLTELVNQYEKDVNAEIDRQVEIRKTSLIPEMSDEIRKIDDQITEKTDARDAMRPQLATAEAERTRISEATAAAVAKATAERDRIAADRDALKAEIARIDSSHSEELRTRREKFVKDKDVTEIAVLARQQDIYDLEYAMNQGISTLEARKIKDVAIPDKAIADAQAKIDETRPKLDEARAKKAEELAKLYTTRMIAVANTPGGELASLGITKTCFQVINRGDKAVTAITLDLVHNGKSVREASIDPATIADLPEMRNTTPKVETASGRVVIGIPPHMAWPAEPACFEVNESFLPENARSMLKAGAPWNVAISEASVSLPSAIQKMQQQANARLLKETWFFPPLSASDVFAKDVRAYIPRFQETHDIISARKTIANNTELRNLLIRLRVIEKHNLQKKYRAQIDPIRREKEKLANHYLSIIGDTEKLDITASQREKLKQVESSLAEAEDELELITSDVSDLSTNIEDLTTKIAGVNQEVQALSEKRAELQSKLTRLQSGGPGAATELRKIIEADFSREDADARWRNDTMTALAEIPGVRTVKTNHEGFFRFDNVRQVDGYLMIYIPRDKTTSYLWIEPVPNTKVRFIKLDSTKGITVKYDDFKSFYNYLAKVVAPEE